MHKIQLYEILYEFEIELWTLDLTNEHLIKFEDFYDIIERAKIFLPLFVRGDKTTQARLFMDDLLI
ncbi:MAG: hypothetical protein ACTSR8_22545 [Promethearchaeota archaeon]